MYASRFAFGSASKIKFINNLLVTVNTAAIGEAIALGLEAGLDPDMMIEQSSGGAVGAVPDPCIPHGSEELPASARHVRDALLSYFDIGNGGYRSSITTVPDRRRQPLRRARHSEWPRGPRHAPAVDSK